MKFKSRNYHVTDFEAYPSGFWLCVIFSFIGGVMQAPIVIKEPAALSEFYLNHLEDIYISYNGIEYDQWIYKAILGGIPPYNMSHFLIDDFNTDENGKKVRNRGWEYSSLLNDYKLNMFDVYQNFRGKSLKRLEGRLGDSIKESSVKFDTKRELTEAEKEEIEQYCLNDVIETAKIWSMDSSYFLAKMSIIEDFGLDIADISKTSSRLAAKVLDARKGAVDDSDQWDVSILSCIYLSKYHSILEQFYELISDIKRNEANGVVVLTSLDAVKKALLIAEKGSDEEDENEEDNDEGDNTDDNKNGSGKDGVSEVKDKVKFNVIMNGISCGFGFGGLHAAIKKYHHKCADDEIVLDIDVESFYPSMMIEWNLGSRASENFKELFGQLKTKRLELKAKAKEAKLAGDLEKAKYYDSKQLPYKILINAVFGSSGDKYSALYDPRRCKEVCINGQLMLAMLIEKLEPYCKLIQANTDGLFILLKKKDREKVESICREWENITRMKLDSKEFDEIHQRDVSNYIAINHSTGDVVRKGKDCKKKDKLDNELAIVNEAVAAYFIEGKNPRDVIYACDELIKFQRIYTVTNKYGAAFLGNSQEPLPHKNYRVFASTRKTDSDFRHAKKDEEGNYLTKEKYTESPEHCFYDNDDIKGKRCPDYLDKDYYVNLAIKRINSFMPAKGKI